MNTSFRLSRIFSVAFAISLFAWRSAAIVTPAPGRAFATNAAGSNIIAQMQFEGGNPVLSNLVVHFVNFSPVDATGDGVADYEQWTGTLISPEWVLTCAHALQGTNGRGGGLVTNDIFFNFGGTSFPDPTSASIAEFRLHPAWAKSGFTNGNDIALVRLAVPVTNVTVFPRLPGLGFAVETPVLFAGYGFQGNGDTGEGTNVPSNVAIGVNTLDGIGGQPMNNGFGNPNTAYSNWVASVAFMDFDKSERRDVDCGGNTNSVELLLSEFSSMGNENLAAAPAIKPCATNAAAISNTFFSAYCDFLPAAGDSGGPAFSWPNAPNLPTPGTHFITNAPTILGVMSYRSRGTSPTNATSIYGNVVAFTLVQPFVGWIYQETGLAGAGPATFLKKPLDVQLANIRILSEHQIGANETEIEFTADVHNLDTGHYREVGLNITRTNLPESLSVVDFQLEYPVLGEMGTVIAGNDDTLVIRVANADLNAARAAILDGSALEVTAFEEQVYTGPQKYIDQPTDTTFESTTFNGFGELVLVFSSETTLISELQNGDILIADPTPGAYRPKQPSRTEQFPVPYLSQQVPFEISSVSQVNGKTHVAGHKRDIFAILKSGTFVASDENFNSGFRDLFDPPVENTYTEAEKEVRKERGEIIQQTDPSNSGLADLLGMNAIPIHFNDVEITKYLHLSGQVLLRSSGLRTQLSFRNFALKKASVGIDAGIVASMVLETTGTNNNVNAPFLEKQKELAHLPLAVLPFTVAGVPCTIDLSFTLAVGAEADAPAGLSIPLETSATIGAEIGWTNGQSFSTPMSEFVAPHVSDPTVFDAVAISAKAWAEAKLEAHLSVAGGLASAGPSLGIRAQAEFAVEPFNNPWWTMDSDADLVGAFELNFLGLNVARVEATNHIATFFHKDAGGPLIPAALADVKAAGDRTNTPSLLPTAGKNTRWALAFASQTGNGTYYNKGFVIPLSGGGYCVGGGHPIPSFLGRISADGNILWMQDFPNGAKPVDGLQLPDGSLMIAGYAGLDWWLAKYDTSGVRQWIVSRRVNGTFSDLEFGMATNGDPEFYLAGYFNSGLVTFNTPQVLKFDKDGNFIWSKAYTSTRNGVVYAMRKLADGNFALVGTTDSQIGTDPIIGGRGSGLVMKINPDGEVLWATAVAGRWGMLFRDVAEAPDGSLYTVGQHGDIIVNYYPGILVAKFSSDGALINHVLIGEDPDDDELPLNGDTPYDTATQAAWTSNGLLVAGNSGLGATESAFVMNVTDELGVRWFSSFDGPNTCVLEDIAMSEDGIAALGSVSPGLWPIEFATRTSTWLLSLPWEGLMQFHPDAGVKNIYLQPHVFLSSAHPDFMGRFTDAAGHSYMEPTAPVSFVISNTVIAAGGNIVAGVFRTFDTVRLENVPPSLVDNYNEWAGYYQMDGTNATSTGDFDGDGLNNGFEFFFGSDPLVKNTNALPFLSIEHDNVSSTVAIDFLRTQAAANLPLSLEYTTNFDGWIAVTNATLSVTSSEIDLFDALRLTLPEPDPEKAFFRLQVDLP